MFALDASSFLSSHLAHLSSSFCIISHFPHPRIIWHFTHHPHLHHHHLIFRRSFSSYFCLLPFHATFLSFISDISDILHFVIIIRHRFWRSSLTFFDDIDSSFSRIAAHFSRRRRVIFAPHHFCHHHRHFRDFFGGIATARHPHRRGAASSRHRIDILGAPRRHRGGVVSASSARIIIGLGVIARRIGARRRRHHHHRRRRARIGIFPRHVGILSSSRRHHRVGDASTRRMLPRRIDIGGAFPLSTYPSFYAFLSASSRRLASRDITVSSRHLRRRRVRFRASCADTSFLRHPRSTRVRRRTLDVDVGIASRRHRASCRVMPRHRLISSSSSIAIFVIGIGVIASRHHIIVIFIISSSSVIVICHLFVIVIFVIIIDIFLSSSAASSRHRFLFLHRLLSSASATSSSFLSFLSFLTFCTSSIGFSFFGGVMATLLTHQRVIFIISIDGIVIDGVIAFSSHAFVIFVIALISHFPLTSFAHLLTALSF